MRLLRCVAGIYLSCTMSVTTLSMILTVLVLNLHEMRDTPVPRWLRVLALGPSRPPPAAFSQSAAHRLGTAPCNGLVNGVSRRAASRRPGHRALGGLRGRRPGYGALPGVDGKRLGHGAWNGLGGRRAEHGALPGLDGKWPVHDAWNYYDGETCYLDGDMDDCEGRVATEGAHSADWRRVATAVDRLLFATFLLAQVAISLYLFHPLLVKGVYSSNIEM